MVGDATMFEDSFRRRACATLLASMALGGCFTVPESEPLAPPPPNPRILGADAPLLLPPEPRLANVYFECSNGAPEDLDVLRTLCNDGPIEWVFYRLEDETSTGWGLALREEEWDPEAASQGLLLFVSYPRESEDPIDDARFSALVGFPVPQQWMSAVPAFRGEVHTEVLSERPCGQFWVGSASLQWRATTIRVHWTAAGVC